MPLNPNAREFSFNPGACEFVPGSGSSFSFAFTATAAPFVPASESSKPLSKDAEPFVPGGATYQASDSNASAIASAAPSVKTEEVEVAAAPATQAPEKAEAVATVEESAAPASAAPANHAPASSPSRSWAALAAKPNASPAPAPAVPAAAVHTNGTEKPADKVASEPAKKAAEPAPSPAPSPAKPSAAAAVAPATPAPASPAPAVKPVAAAASPSPAAPSPSAKAAAAAAAHGSRRPGGKRWDLATMLALRECGTPLDVLKLQIEDLRKCIDEPSEATTALFDLQKDMTNKQSQPSEGGRDGNAPRGMRRQNSDGSMRGRGGGKNNKNQPLVDKHGQVIEVKALEMTETRWKPSKPTDDEAKLLKTAKGLLNKLTLEKFDTLYQQILNCGIATASLLRGFVVLLYDKAVMEPTFIGMYARMCEKLAADLPELSDEHGVLPFAEVLIGKCRSEFDVMGKEPELEGLDSLPADEREQKMRKLRQRELGNVEFIGELFTRGMVGVDVVELSMSRMVEESEADHDKIQPLCKLLEHVGKLLESQDKEVLDDCFASLELLRESAALNSRYKFMLMDLVDLRRGGWVPRREANGPKTLEEVHKEVDKEKRYTEKKKEKPAAKPKKEEKGKRGRGPGAKKEEKKEDEGWSQVTTDKAKGKQQQVARKGGKKVEEPPPPPPKGKAAPAAPAKGIPAVRSGFAALMDEDDDDDDDDSDSSSEEEEEEDAEAEAEEDEDEEGEDEGGESELCEAAVAKVGSILEEFLCIHDVEEASQCIQELDKSYPRAQLNEEIVHRGLLLALDASDRECELMGRMFASLVKDEVLTGEEVAHGLCKVLRDLPDVAIDIPKAPSLLGGVCRELCLERKLVEPSLLSDAIADLRASCPTSARHFDGLGA